MDDRINPYAAPSAIETDADTAQLTDLQRESLRGVAAGLTIICVSLVVFGALQLLLAAAFINRYFGIIGPVQVPDDLNTAGALAVNLLIVLGKIRCASVPSESRAREWIYLSATSSALLIPFFLPWIVGRPFDGTETFWWLSNVVAIFSNATFFLFFRRLAFFMERSDYAKRAVQLLVLYGIWEAVRYGMPLVEARLLPWATTAHGVAGWPHRLVFLAEGCQYVLIFAVIVKYFNLARALRSAIRGFNPG